MSNYLTSADLVKNGRFDIYCPVTDQYQLSRAWHRLPKAFWYLLDDENYPTNIVPVVYNSRLFLRKAAYRFGIYFRREFNYDFPPYPSGEKYKDKETTFLISCDTFYLPQHFIGAIGFEYDLFKDFHGYVLTWAWIHPYQRREGKLQELWPYFKEHFAPFAVQAPLSKAMKTFLKKNSPEVFKEPYLVQKGDK